MKFELERGTFCYIKKKKTRQIGMILLLMVIAVIMFIVGLLLHEFDRANICTVLAILMVLPAAKHLVTFIVLFPYKSVSKEAYDRISGMVDDSAILMTDMVITSSEKVMKLDFVLITDNQVLGLTGKEKQDAAYIEKYLKNTLKDNNIEGFTVKVFEDEKQFVKCIPDREYESTELQEQCYLLIRTLVV